MSEELPRKIVQARIKLMLEQSYLASAVARFPVINAGAMSWCDTLATDGYYIYVNPDFCELFSLDEIAFVFAHEVMHCVLGHIDRRGDREASLWNQAIDYATNLMLIEFGMKMPEVGLIDHHYRGMTAEDIYDIFKKKGKRRQKSGERKKNGTESSDFGMSDAMDGGEGQSSKAADGFDHHLSPDDIRGKPFRLNEFPTSEERKRLRISLTREIESKMRGTAAGLMASEIQKATKAEVPWHILLSRFFTGLRRDDYRMMPPNKKHIVRGLYLPSMGVPGPDHLVVAIDTSGSMRDDELSKILAEIDALRSITQCTLTLIQCDALIQDVQQFNEYTEISFDRYRLLGGGGTSFVPVFDWIRDNIFKEFSGVDALIYLTDGFGRFPQKAPPYPVLWIMTANSIPEVPFGEVIRMSSLRAAA
jgi:predicted metal-dependent peptidase